MIADSQYHECVFFLAIILAGIPTAMELSGTDASTTAFAPISTLLPMVIFPRIFAPAPILILLPKHGAAFSEIFFNPMVTPLRIIQLSPKLAYPLMMISPK